MSAVVRRMTEVPGEEALWLLAGVPGGRVVVVRRGQAVVRPGAHVLEYGRLVVRAPVALAVVAAAGRAAYHVDHVDSPTRSGWSVTVDGPVEVVGDPHEAAHYRRTLLGWAHGPHDAVLRINPEAVQGFRLDDAADPRAGGGGA